MELKDLLKITQKAVGKNTVHVTATIDTATIEEVKKVCSLLAAAAPGGHPGLGSLQTMYANVLAALYQDDDAHEDCSLTACLNPLHPGPCKGWKGTLHDVSPGAWHALEGARVEKANHARVKKIEALKAQGKPIPHKLLQPIVAKPNPQAGQTAKSATGEAHAAGKAVSDAAGIVNNHPGKVSLGQAVKAGPVVKGPKGKKPTLASHGIAFVIGQEKVTPQYKLDKTAAITPEQWAGLSSDDKASIRGELAKIKKDGFGPQQKKADELLAKLADKPADLKPNTPGTITTPSGKVYQKVALKEGTNPYKVTPVKVAEAHEPTPKFVGQKDSHGVVSKAKPGGETTVATSVGVPNGYQITKDGMGWSLKHKGKLIRTSSTKEALVQYAQEHHAKNTAVAPKVETAHEPGPKLGDAGKAKAEPYTTMTPTNVVKLIQKNGSADLILGGEKVKVGFEGKGHPGKIIMVEGGHYKVTTADGKKFDIAKGEHVKVADSPASSTPKLASDEAVGKLSDALKKAAPSAEPGSHAPKVSYVPGAKLGEAPQLAPLKEAPKPPEKPKGLPPLAKPKPLPKHVTDAIAMAKGQAPGASWSKNHLAAYQQLSPEEYQALPTDVQDKIDAELTKAQSKFLDPKKIAAAKSLQEKLNAASDAPKSAASPKVEKVGFVDHLHDHTVTATQAKSAVEDVPIGTHFLAAKQMGVLSDADNPDLGFHALNAADDAKALVGVKTKLYDAKVLGQPDVKAATDALTTAAAKQSFAKSVLDTKTKAYSKITVKLKVDGDKLSPIEKASLEHYQKYLLNHPSTFTAVDVHNLKAATKDAEANLVDKIHAAVKAANAPKPADMSPAQIADRAEELLGKNAFPHTNLTLSELQLADKVGKAQADDEAKQFPEAVLSDPTVAAKKAAYASVITQILASKQEIHKLQEHIKTVHQAAILSGKDQHGNPLTSADQQVLANHAIMLGKSHSHLGKTLEHQEAKYPEAKAAFLSAAEKATANLKPAEPHKLTDFDQATIGDAYANAWSKHVSKAVTYGVKSYADGQKMKAHSQYPSLTMDLGELKVLAGKVAVAHAEEHTAKLNVPIEPDTGAKVHGPEYNAWQAAMGHRADLEQQFAKQHKTAQARLDHIRVDAGLKKRALPKLDTASVKSTAAESGYYKSTSYSGPNYGKPASGKNYLLSKVGPKLAVAHQTPSEKKSEKLGAAAVKTPSSPKIENVPSEPVKLGGDSSIAHLPDPLKKQITSDFKGMPKGKYLADPTEDIFGNLVNLAAAHSKGLPEPLSVDQVLKTIDETHSKNLGVGNSGMLHKKVTDWLGTASGKTWAEQHSTPDAKVVKQINGEIDLPKGVTLAPGEKVQKLAGPGPHDEALPPTAFKAATSKQAQDAQDAYMQANGAKWSAQQKAALKSYTGSAYTTYNDYLRGSGSGSQTTKQHVVNIQSAMMPLPQHTLLKRGTGWSALPAEFQGANAAKMVGKTFQEPGFTSTTVAGMGGHFSGQPLQLIIEAPAGTPAAFVNGISHFKDQENEMLLAAGTKFKVLSVEKTTGGNTIMRVRIVGDK